MQRAYWFETKTDIILVVYPCNSRNEKQHLKVLSQSDINTNWSAILYNIKDCRYWVFYTLGNQTCGLNTTCGCGTGMGFIMVQPFWFYLYVRICVHTRMYMHTHVHVHIRAHVCIRVRVYVYTCIHVRVCARENNYKHMQITRINDTFGICDQNPLKVPILIKS